MCSALKAPFSAHAFRHRHPRLLPARQPARPAFAATKLAISLKKNKRITLVGICLGQRKKGLGGIPFTQRAPHPAWRVLLVSGVAGAQVNSQLCQIPASKEAEKLKFQFTTTLLLPSPLSLLKTVRKESIFLASPDSVQHIRTVS